MAKNETRKQWKVNYMSTNQKQKKSNTNLIVADNKSSTDPVVRANIFNEYLVNIGKTIIVDSVNYYISITSEMCDYNE